MTKRTAERKEFLSDLLVTAIEHYGYGFPTVHEYHHPEGKPGEWFAVISDRYEEDASGADKTYRVDIDTMAKGIGVWRRSAHMPKAFTLADRTNGDDGDFDVIDALAVLECALFGEVVYG